MHEHIYQESLQRIFPIVEQNTYSKQTDLPAPHMHPLSVYAGTYLHLIHQVHDVKDTYFGEMALPPVYVEINHHSKSVHEEQPSCPQPLSTTACEIPSRI